MIFESAFPKNKILSILCATTRPLNFSNSMTGDIFLSKSRGDKIYLLKSGKFGVGKGQLPLIIKLIENDSNTILKCKFGFTLPSIIILSLFVGFAWSTVLLICVFSPNNDLIGKLIVSSVALIWSLFCFALFPIANVLLFSKQQKEVIVFLESHLCAKRIS
ncbi:hypothetical protein [Acetivibrio cellulolyticus]|uniref:hypothetical protein n=1 Tax=Acetivibrio cellulolyticus TaxID=35830 RepID=UPI0001E2F5D2|nr:hypothetical protein [Acetivibrio cellulolyticus]